MPEWADHLRRRLASLRLAPAREHEIVQELSQHLEDRWRELVAGGASEDEATRLALAEFREGNLLAQYLAPLEQAQTPIPITPGVATGQVLGDAWLDLRYAARGLRKQPAVTVAAVLTLALGIGANTAIFSLTDQVLLRPLPVPRPQELVMLDSPGIYQGATRGQQTFSEPMFRGLHAASAPVLSGMLARYGTTAAVNAGGDSDRVRIEVVSGDYFRTLGIRPVAGRVLGPDDDRIPDAHPVVVLSHAYWQRRFGADPDVVGRPIRVNGFPMTIVGVAAPGFSGFDLGQPADLFAPLMMDSALTPTWKGLDDWRTRWLHVSGRLRPGVTPERVAEVLNVRYRQLLAEDFKTVRVTFSPEGRAAFLGKTLEVLPAAKGRSQLRADFSSPLLALMAMVAVVLLIACVNVANLLMARASTQQQEVAVRLALGAGRFRLVRQRLTESLVLAGAGTLAGLLVASSATRLLID